MLSPQWHLCPRRDIRVERALGNLVHHACEGVVALIVRFPAAIVWNERVVDPKMPEHERCHLRVHARVRAAGLRIERELRYCTSIDVRLVLFDSDA